MKTINVLGLTTVLIAVAGCGGSGGGTAFKSFSEIKADDTTKIEGEAKLVEYSIDEDTGVTTVGEAADTTAQVKLTTDEFFALVAASITTGASGFGGGPNAEFAVEDGDEFGDGDALDPMAADFAIAQTAEGDVAAIVGDPAALGFEYQSFGVWATGIDVGAGIAGTASVGARTPASAVQNLNGTAIYSGKATGFYVDAAGTAYLAFADFDASLDFDDQEMGVQSSNTGVIDVLTGASMAMSSLNFTGNGSIATGGPLGSDDAEAGTFQADISTVLMDLSGSLDGRLYGPNGEEIGGLFEMMGDDGLYMGSVGAVD